MEPLLQNRWKTAGQESYGRYVHKHEKHKLEPCASHSEYNMYNCVFSRKFGIWHKFSHPPRSTCNNLQLCAPGIFGKVQSSGYLCPPYSFLKNKAAGPWRTYAINARLSSTPDYGSYVQRTALLQKRWWESGTSPDPLRTPQMYTASQPGYPISVNMPWTWHTFPHQAHKKPCKSAKIFSTECCKKWPMRATVPASCGLTANTQESHGSEYGRTYTPRDIPTP